jgi:REP element-mobilizing transposase RayT
MPGPAQFLNYRLDDAMPASRRHEWATLLEMDDELKRREKSEAYLDRGLGNCELRDPRAAAIIEENWLHADGQDDRLLAWVVMPNHSHLLVEIWQKPLARLIKVWKGYTAQRINRVLGPLCPRVKSKRHGDERNPSAFITAPERFAPRRFRRTGGQGRPRSCCPHSDAPLTPALELLRGVAWIESRRWLLGLRKLQAHPAAP